MRNFLLIITFLLLSLSQANAQSTPLPNGVNGPVKQFGAVTSGHCTSWKTGNYIQDSGSACGGGGGGGSPGGTSGQIQFNNAGSFGGFTLSGDGTVNTSTGVLTITGSASSFAVGGNLGIGSGSVVTISGSTGNIQTSGTFDSLAITAGTGSTLSVAAGKTLTGSNTLTFTGTDGSSVNFGTGGIVAYTSGLSAIALGTSTTSANPQISGDVTSGFYTPAASTVAVASGGTQVVSWVSGAESITGTDTIKSNSAAALIVGANGATNPVLTVDASTASIATGVAIKGDVTGGNTSITATDSGANTSIQLIGKGNGSVNIGSNTYAGNISIQDGNASAAITINANNASSAINLSIAASNFEKIQAPNVTFSPAASTAAATTRFLYTPAADTSLTLGVNAIIAKWAGSSVTRQHATGSLALQTDYSFEAVTDRFVGASTLTDAATMQIFNLPGCGTNATCTNVSGLYHTSSALTVTGPSTNSYIINVAADTGATNNYAEQLSGDIKLSPGATAPTVTTCGGGSITAGSTSNKWTVTGITAATACTITFANPLGTAPVCTFNTSTGIAVGGIPTTTGVTTTMAALTGTLQGLCF